MPRTRQISFGFFKNEDLCELSPLHRLFFEGLWCLADRMGRLVDRPRRLRAEILAYDRCDGEKLMSDLASRDFVRRYEANGERYIWIPKFKEWQSVHPNEIASEFPRHPDDPNSEEYPPKDPRRGSSTDAASTQQASSDADSGQHDGISSYASVSSSSLSSLPSFVLSSADKPAAAAEGNPDPVPEKPKPKRERKPSAWEQLRSELRDARAQNLGPGAVPDVEFGPSRLNAEFGELAKAAAKCGVGLPAAYAEFLADPFWGEPDKHPPWPLPAFVSQFAKYASRAKEQPRKFALRNPDLATGRATEPIPVEHPPCAVTRCPRPGVSVFDGTAIRGCREHAGEWNLFVMRTCGREPDSSDGDVLQDWLKTNPEVACTS